MRIPAMCTALSLVITLSGLRVSAAAAEAAPAEPAAPALPAFADVMPDPSMDDLEYARSWAAIGIDRGLAKHPMDAAVLGPRRLRVDLAGSFGAYRIAVGLTEDGEWSGDLQDRKCPCDTEEMINAIAEMVAALAAELREGPPRPETRPETGTAPRSSGSSADRRPPLATLGKAGIGVAAGGLAIAGVGVGFLVRGRRLAGDATDESRVGRDFTVPGAIALAGGVALFATGLGLLGADRGKARRARASAWWSPGRGGVAFTGRF